MLPQFIFCYRDPENRDKLLTAYVLVLGTYRFFYALNWIERKVTHNFFYISGPVGLGILAIFLADFIAFKLRHKSCISSFVLRIGLQLQQQQQLNFPRFPFAAENPGQPASSRIPAALLLRFCWAAAALLLRCCCRAVAGLLLHCCWAAAGLRLGCCWPAPAAALLLEHLFCCCFCGILCCADDTMQVSRLPLLSGLGDEYERVNPGSGAPGGPPSGPPGPTVIAVGRAAPVELDSRTVQVLGRPQGPPLYDEPPGETPRVLLLLLLLHGARAAAAATRGLCCSCCCCPEPVL